ncbi:MAG: TRZ/ATZ family hydrolase [Gammaproteobacteria bacterium]|nr:TRZ/ATZ family hydrolase [Gammaproteobacteria bacterium]
MNVDTLICARWVIPVEPQGAVLPDHAVAVDGGRIVDVLPAEQARVRYRPLNVHELDGHALLPGFVNAHTHAAMSLFRGLADDLPLMDWLNQHIWPAEQRLASPQFVSDGSRLAFAEMIRGGTTCFNDMYFFPEQTAEAAVEAGMRALLGLVFIDFPTAWARDADDYFARGLALHDRYKNHPLIRTAFAPHSPYTVSNAPLTKINALAQELGIPIHMHVHESEEEIAQSMDLHGKRPLERLAELGLLGPQLIAVHMTRLEWPDIELVAKHGVHVTHCPQSNLKLASGFCPVTDLLGAGVNVALGTDGAASNNDLDMIDEMRSAALLAKGMAGDPRALPAAQALTLATLNAARALGMDQLIGSLVKDKQADLIAIDLNRPETQPVFDPISQIIYSADRSQVTDVWVAGRQLLRERELLTINEAEALERAREWRGKVLS